MKKTDSLFFVYFASVLLWLGSAPAAWAQCAAPTGLTVSNITGTTATLTFTGPAAATSYTVSYTYPAGGTAQVVSPNPTASPVNLTNLLPVTTYTVSVTSNCAGGTSSPAATLTFRTTVLNDEPCAAPLLALGGATCQATTGTTTGATTTPANGYALYGCEIGTGWPPFDVWYRFTTASSGPASTGVTVTSTAAQLRLFAATSCAGPFNELACSTSFASGQAAPPLVAGGLSPNTTYYVRVAPYNGATGAFTICVTDPPACGNPNFVTVGPVTATTAQLQFLPGPGNTGYTVTYVPLTGGTPTTVTFAQGNSPLTLTGLVPLTNYVVTVQATCPSGGPGAVTTLTLTSGNLQDEPAGAVALPINATCQPTVGTLMQASATVPNGYGAPACSPTTTSPLDIWYTVTTPATGLASQGITLTASNPSTTTPPNAYLLRLFSSANGAAGPFTEIGCSASDTFPLLPAPLIVGGLSPSTTYYVAVVGYTTTGINPLPSQFQFTLCATAAPACPAPTALTATLLSRTSARLNWQTTGPGVTSTVEYGPTGFVPGTSAPGAVLVPGLTANTYTATNLTPGQPYQFYVSRDCGAGALSTRNGPIAFQTQVLANDEPCGALPVTLSGTTCATPTAGTLVGATQSDAFLAFCGSQNPNTDIWYTFTTAATGPASTGATITVTGTSATHIAVGSASSCAGPFTTLGCTTGNPIGPFAHAAPPLVLRTLTPNTTYYVRVGYEYDYQAPPAGPITICVTDPAVCNNIITTAITAITATSAVVTFSPVIGTTGYTVTVTGPNGIPSTITSTTRPIPITGLLPSTVYTVTVASNCANGQSLPVTQMFSTTPVGPVNEVCTGALPIVCGQTIIASTVNAHLTTLPTGSQCGTVLNGGLFYHFVGTGYNVDLTTCHAATNFPTTIRVFSGTCGTLSCVGGANNSTCALNPEYAQYSFLSQLGGSYYIYVLGTQPLSPEGSFGLTLTCTLPPCLAPTNAATSLITPTTASISFVAGGPATSYSATATPTAGGPAVTVSGPASPLSLAGLAPNTAYTVQVTATCGTAQSAPALATFSTPLASRAAALAAQVTLYPNPAHHAVTLSLPATLSRQGGQVVLFNSLGQLVQQQALLTADKMQVLLNGLAVGVYTVQVQAGTEVVTKRLVIE